MRMTTMAGQSLDSSDIVRLFRRAAEGDLGAWERLVDQYARLIWSITAEYKLAATARNECLRSLAVRKRVVLGHDEAELDTTVAHGPEIDERLLADESAQVVRDALSRLPRRWQRLLEMLMADPPVPYADISDELGLPIGSIGPTRGRCLARLRVLLQAS